MKYATRILASVIAEVNRKNFYWKFVDLLYVFAAAAVFTSTHRNFIDDDTRNSTSTKNPCFFDDVVHYGLACSKHWKLTKTVIKYVTMQTFLSNWQG